MKPRLMLNNLDLLHICAKHDDIRTADIVERLQLSHTTLSTMKAKMMNLGLLVRRRYSADIRQGYTYHTTPLGVELLRKYAAMLKDYNVTTGLW